jgi:hypothetical protein
MSYYLHHAVLQGYKKSLINMQFYYYKGTKLRGNLSEPSLE